MMEVMLTIDPPPAFAMRPAASFVPRNTLVWLTAILVSALPDLSTNLTTAARGALVCRNRHALISPVRDTSIRTLSLNEASAPRNLPR